MVEGMTTGAAAGIRAVILAGGKGVRLRPFTVSFPKPLIPLGDDPILEVLIKRLVAFGITDITLTLGHLAELIKAYFYTHNRLTAQVRLRYVEEDKPTALETARYLANFQKGRSPGTDYPAPPDRLHMCLISETRF